MIGVDTNVVVRYVMQDDPNQALAATRFFNRLRPDAPGYVSAIVLAELSWVLTTTYGASRAEMTSVIERLLATSALLVEYGDCARRAVAKCLQAGADFADALIAEINAAAGCDETVTFDRAGAKRAGMRLLR